MRRLRQLVKNLEPSVTVRPWPNAVKLAATRSPPGINLLPAILHRRVKTAVGLLA